MCARGWSLCCTSVSVGACGRINAWPVWVTHKNLMCPLNRVVFFFIFYIWCYSSKPFCYIRMEICLMLGGKLVVYLPMVEHGQSKGLSLCMCAKVSLKAEGVDGWDKSFNGVERRPWNRCILGDVTPVRWQTDDMFKSQIVLQRRLLHLCMRVYCQCIAFCQHMRIKSVYKPSSSQHCVHSRHTISWSLNLHKVIGLHQPWSGL